MEEGMKMRGTKEVDVASRTPPNGFPASFSPTYKNHDNNKNTIKDALHSQFSPDKPDNGHAEDGRISLEASEERVAKLYRDGTNSLIQAWEDKRESKTLNSYNKKLSKILAWENTKKTTAEARLRKAEEKLEKKRAGNLEKMRNEIACARKKAEEKKAKAEVKKGRALIKIEEKAAQYRANGRQPPSLNYFCCHCLTAP